MTENGCLIQVEADYTRCFSSEVRSKTRRLTLRLPARTFLFSLRSLQLTFASIGLERVSTGNERKLDKERDELVCGKNE